MQTVILTSVLLCLPSITIDTITIDYPMIMPAYMYLWMRHICMHAQTCLHTETHQPLVNTRHTRRALNSNHNKRYISVIFHIQIIKIYFISYRGIVIEELFKKLQICQQERKFTKGNNF